MPIKLIIAALLAALLAISGATLAFAGSDGSSDDGGARVITLFTTTDQDHVVDVAPMNELSLGDEEVFSDVVSETRGGSGTGSTGVVCTVVNVGKDKGTATSECEATLSVSAGQITVQGLVTLAGGAPPSPFDLAVTGGTGAFEGAGGHITVEELSETESKLTFHLLLED
jgi:hypothetical protein